MAKKLPGRARVIYQSEALYGITSQMAMLDKKPLLAHLKLAFSNFAGFKVQTTASALIVKMSINLANLRESTLFLLNHLQLLLIILII